MCTNFKTQMVKISKQGLLMGERKNDETGKVENSEFSNFTESMKEG